MNQCHEKRSPSDRALCLSVYVFWSGNVLNDPVASVLGC